MPDYIKNWKTGEWEREFSIKDYAELVEKYGSEDAVADAFINNEMPEWEHSFMAQYELCMLRVLLRMLRRILDKVSQP